MTLLLGPAGTLTPLHNTDFATHEQARLELFEYIEVFSSSPTSPGLDCLKSQDCGVEPHDGCGLLG